MKVEAISNVANIGTFVLTLILVVIAIWPSVLPMVNLMTSWVMPSILAGGMVTAAFLQFKAARVRAQTESDNRAEVTAAHPPLPPAPEPPASPAQIIDAAEAERIAISRRELRRLNDVQLLAIAKLLKYGTLNGDKLTHWMMKGGFEFGSELERKKLASTMFGRINELTSLLDRDEGSPDEAEHWSLRDPESVRKALPDVFAMTFYA